MPSCREGWPPVSKGLEYGIIVQKQCHVTMDGVGVNFLF
jgi:hypothetical protein